MSHASPDGLTLLNGRLQDGSLTSVRIAGARIDALGARPSPGDSVIDLQGDRVLPGLINAHDHLQLNSLRACDSGKRYHHAREWAADVAARRDTDAQFASSIAVSREERLMAGGIKNLLSGVTTVAHHDALYPFLTGDDYPVEVVRCYGWAHSLYVSGDAEVQRSFEATPAEWPWVIHAAEGVDPEAAEEFDRLDSLGCLEPNTLLVHGTALDPARRARLRAAGAGLIWCPASNMGLFGRTAQLDGLLAHGRVALGTDSRMTGSRDLLEELRFAADCAGLDGAALESLVTRDAARLLCLPDRGALRAGLRADITVLPDGISLGLAARSDVRLVLVGGVPRYGDAERIPRSALAGTWAQIRVDGAAKLLDARIAAQLRGSAAREPGMEILDRTWKAA